MADVFFDLDGTLTDPKEGITASIQYALRRQGLKAPKKSELEWCIGPPLIESLSTLIGNTEDAETALGYYRERFAEIGLYENEIYDDIPEVLTDLSDAGHTLYVATSKPKVFADRILEHFELAAYFRMIFGSELDGSRVVKKDLLDYGLSQARVDPRQAVMVGDREHDIHGARANSMRTIGVLYGYGSKSELKRAGAEYTCEHVHKIPHHIRELTNDL